MVDNLFICATLTGRRGGHTPFVQAGVETPDTGAEAVKPDPGSSWEGHSRNRAGLKRMQLHWAPRLWGPAPWRLGRLLIFGKKYFRSRNVETAGKSHC